MFRWYEEGEREEEPSKPIKYYFTTWKGFMLLVLYLIGWYILIFIINGMANAIRI